MMYSLTMIITIMMIIIIMMMIIVMLHIILILTINIYSICKLPPCVHGRAGRRTGLSRTPTRRPVGMGGGRNAPPVLGWLRLGWLKIP